MVVSGDITFEKISLIISAAVIRINKPIIKYRRCERDKIHPWYIVYSMLY